MFLKNKDINILALNLVETESLIKLIAEFVNYLNLV